MPDPTAKSSGTSHVNIRRYVATPPEMNQPAMSDNLICMHLGGAKEVRRWCDGRQTVHDVELGALTIMPARQSSRWLTRGPVDFAHLTLSEALIGEMAAEEFGRDPATCQLADLVGQSDPYLERLFATLLAAIEGRDGHGRLLLDSLLVVMVSHLLDHHAITNGRAAAPTAPSLQRGGLAPWRLQRVVHHMRAHLGQDVGLAELTQESGLSRAQFFRAFKQSTGMTPHRYMTELRLEEARRLLDARAIDVSQVGAAVGLRSSPKFSALFARRFGQTPRAYGSR